MFKNIVIIILVFLLCSLLFQNRDNVNILVKDMADTKELVVGGAKYVKEAIDKEFSDEKIKIDIPSMQIQKEPFSEGSTNGRIEEDTFFKESNK